MLPRFARFLTLLLAAIQFAAPAVVSVADGAYSRQVQAVAHVEASGGEECTPPHTADCSVCRYLTDEPSESTHGASEAIPADAAPAPRASARLVAAVDGAPTRSRAPPAV